MFYTYINKITPLHGLWFNLIKQVSFMRLIKKKETMPWTYFFSILFFIHWHVVVNCNHFIWFFNCEQQNYILYSHTLIIRLNCYINIIRNTFTTFRKMIKMFLLSMWMNFHSFHIFFSFQESFLSFFRFASTGCTTTKSRGRTSTKMPKAKSINN